MQTQSRFLAGSSIALFAILFVSVAFAQVATTGTTDSVQIEAGQMLEIGTDTTAENPDFSWILTKNRTFQSAQRSRFFQTRPAQTGNYMLDVSVQGQNGTQNEYKAFAIVVTEPGPLKEPVVSSGAILHAALKTIPEAINGTVYLPPAGGILILDGTFSSGQINSYSLDLDTHRDTDGDGNPANDRDNEDTYSEQSGSPLVYFTLPSAEPRTMQLSVWNSVTGETDTEEIRVEFSTTPSSTPSDLPLEASSEIVIEGSDSSARFIPQLPESITVGKQLLYEWDFGDRSRSLLTTPSHTYKTSGTFAVTLIVRDITNGQIVFQGTNSVTIQSSPQETQSSAQSSSSSAVQEPEKEKASSSLGSIITVGIIVLFLLAIAMGMYMLFMWIKNKTAGHLSSTLENMEKTIVQGTKNGEAPAEPLKLKKEAPPTPLSPPAAALKQEDISEREKAKTEFASKTRDHPVPVSSSGPVPSWLSKASTSAPPVESEEKAAPAPSKPQSTTSASAGMQVSAPKTSAPPVPDWLKPSPKKEVKPEPTPTITKESPKPAPTPAPAAPPKPVTVKIEEKVAPAGLKSPQEQVKTTPKEKMPLSAPAFKPVIAVQNEKPPVKNATIPEPKTTGNEEPIAFIQADSLTK